MSIPDRKIVPTSRLSCRNQSPVPPHTSLMLMILAAMQSASPSSPQSTVGLTLPCVQGIEPPDDFGAQRTSTVGPDP